VTPSATLALEIIRRWARAQSLDLQENPLTGSGAVFSRCGHYRYLLWRRPVSDQPFMSFAMLNPSTADALDDDPTIRRCTQWVINSGMAGPLVWNLFALRSAYPKVLKCSSLPIGNYNNAAIDLALSISAITIAAWGTHGGYLDRANHVLRRVAVADAQLHTLKITKEGHPAHPLYLSSRLKPLAWDFPA
jgi:hypothetical protein